MTFEKSISITNPRLLVVEGKDECLFFQALLTKLKLPNIQIISYDGKAKLRDFIGALIVTPGYSDVTILGISRDADENPQTAYQSVMDALRRYNLALPEKPLMIAGDKPRIIVMILPDENTQGMLEDLCLRTVKNDNSMKCVDAFFNCLCAKHIPLPRNMSKAKVHAFLASRREADKRLGEAAQAGYWQFGSQSLKQAKDFLRSIAKSKPPK